MGGYISVKVFPYVGYEENHSFHIGLIYESVVVCDKFGGYTVQYNTIQYNTLHVCVCIEENVSLA